MFVKRKIQAHVKKCMKHNSSDNDTDSQSEDQEIQSVISSIGGGDKRRKIIGKSALLMTTQKNSSDTTKESITETYESNLSLGIGTNQRATATADHDTAPEQDHRSILERNEAIGKALLTGELEEGVYRGIGAHRPVINRREGAISSGKHSGMYGPVRGNQHVRMTMRIDLNPEICKDYKETGYCGFGDTCIFLHDRSDYKPGWQLEKEWQLEQKAKQEKDNRRLQKLERKMNSSETTNQSSSSETEESDSDSDCSDSDDEKDVIPKGCTLCKSSWTVEANPVVTQCNHYFCERCALTHYSTSPKCASCGSPTNGLFNTATILLARLQRDNVNKE